MGCDIHPHIERRAATPSARWRHLIRPRWNAKKESPINSLSDRNYWLFAALAGVRNGMGITPLFQGRGLPKNASPGTQKELDSGSDIHSTTWCTVQELVKHDWDRVACHSYLTLPAHGYLDWLDNGRQGYLKESYLGDTSRLPDIDIIGESGMLLMLMAADPDEISPVRPEWIEELKKHPKLVDFEVPRVGTHTVVVSPVTYRQLLPDFVKDVIPALAALGDPKRTRLVFGFDS